MAGVGAVMKLVRQVIGNWKVGKTCELKLISEAGVRSKIKKVKMSEQTNAKITTPVNLKQNQSKPKE